MLSLLIDYDQDNSSVYPVHQYMFYFHLFILYFNITKIFLEHFLINFLINFPINFPINLPINLPINFPIKFPINCYLFEGAIGGMISCMISSMIGANLMQWPYWAITGSSYGIMLSVIALVGDLTASMMKRDANMKDSGNILPGHGGLLDRIDSYMFTAPAAFFFCQNVLPVAIQLQKRAKQFPLVFW